MYTKEELAELGKVCLEHGILIVSDEIYEKLTYGGKTRLNRTAFR